MQGFSIWQNTAHPTYNCGMINVSNWTIVVIRCTKIINNHNIDNIGMTWSSLVIKMRTLDFPLPTHIELRRVDNKARLVVNSQLFSVINQKFQGLLPIFRTLLFIFRFQEIISLFLLLQQSRRRTLNCEHCLTNFNHCNLKTISAKKKTLPVYSVSESMLLGWAVAGAWNHLIIGLKQRSRVVCIWGVSDFTFSSFFFLSHLCCCL